MSEQTFRVPVRQERIKLRTAEPVGYDPAKRTVYKLNATADEILRLVDGQRHEYAIALAVARGDEELARELVAEFRAFLDRCESDGLITWKTP